MFSQACVKNSVHGGGSCVMGGGACMVGDMHGREERRPPKRTYWNAFLFYLAFYFFKKRICTHCDVKKNRCDLPDVSGHPFSATFLFVINSKTFRVGILQLIKRISYQYFVYKFCTNDRSQSVWARGPCPPSSHVKISQQKHLCSRRR